MKPTVTDAKQCFNISGFKCSFFLFALIVLLHANSLQTRNTVNKSIQCIIKDIHNRLLVQSIHTAKEEKVFQLLIKTKD